MGWTFPVTPINIDALITKDYTWKDVDLSTVVPEGTKGIFLLVRQTSGSSFMGLRYKGFTSAPNTLLGANAFTYLFVALDAARKYTMRMQNASNVVEIVAYTDNDCFTPGGAETAYVTLPQTLNDTWTPLNLTGVAPAPAVNAGAALIYWYNTFAGPLLSGTRKNSGSSFLNKLPATGLGFIPAPLDADGTGQVYSATQAGIVFYYVGYLPWTEFSCLPDPVLIPTVTGWNRAVALPISATATGVMLALVNIHATVAKSMFAQSPDVGHPDYTTAKIAAGNVKQYVVSPVTNGTLDLYAEDVNVNAYLVGVFDTEHALAANPAHLAMGMMDADISEYQSGSKSINIEMEM